MHTQASSVRYRPEIDGLRAVAVVPVVLYHYSVPGFGGGFVGVDVFFVISGYLITSLIFAEMRAGRFSVLGFYERRARRILPALFAMLAASFVAAVLLLFPRDVVRFAESAITTVLFAANFDYWQQSGYFDVGADLKPLLHTWSLAVEEQFYLVFPAILYLMHTRRRGSLLALVSGLALVSFALSVWGVRTHPDAAFYLAPYRTWELMAGAILALGEFPVPASRWLRDLILAAGVLLIAWPIATYTPQTLFPGEGALAPCAGAALIIYGGAQGDAFVSRLLSSPPFVGIGLISYSLYLWHWPLYVFAKYGTTAALPVWEIVALVALCALLAYLSWRFVEKPFRNRAGPINRRTLWIAAAGASAAGVCAGAILLFGHGWLERYPPNVQRILAEANDIEPRRHECFDRPLAEVLAGKFCTIGNQAAKTPSFLLLGDSHAEALLPAVDAAEATAGRKGYFISRSRCPPILDLSLSDEPTTRCSQINAEAFRMASAPNISTVILIARWAFLEKGVGYGPDGNTIRHLIDLSGMAPKSLDQRDLFALMLERTIRAYLAIGKKIVLVEPVPEAMTSVPEAYARAVLDGRGASFALPYSTYRARQGEVLAILASLAKKYPIVLVDPARTLCSQMECALARDGLPLYVDHQHLGVFGARLLVPPFAQALN